MTLSLTNNSLICHKILEHSLKYTNTNATATSDIYIILILMMIIILIIMTDNRVDYNTIKNELDELKKQIIDMNKIINNN